MAEEKETQDSAAIIDEAQSQFDECSTEMTNVRKGNGYSWDEREELFFGAYYQTTTGGSRERYMDSTGSSRRSRLIARAV